MPTESRQPVVLPLSCSPRYTYAMTDYIQVVTTTEHQEDAERIARTLVEERLAACVQVSAPIISTYRWQGQIETAREWQCWAKTRRDLYEQVEQAIRRLHPYELPEILAMPILAGSGDYLAWLERETGK
jgi:periplasmic divalent cation tolerance protein